MKVYNICSVQNFNLEPFDKPLHINDVLLVRPEEEPNPEIFDENFLRQAGAIKRDTFKNRWYFMSSFEVDDNYDKVALTKQHLTFRSILYGIMNFLWFSKDSGASTLDAYSFIPTKPDFFLMSYFGSVNSKANGSFDDTLFTIKDLEKAVIAYHLMSKMSSQDYQRKDVQFPVGTQKVMDSGYHYGQHDKTNKIERCMTFLSGARTNSYLPTKISNYVAALECLFTTDEGEVNHKVAERTSRYLAKPETRLEMFRFVKRIYGIRSDFFHGKAQKPKHGSTETLADISVGIDNLLRMVLTRVFLEDRELFLGGRDELSAYFDELIFDDKAIKLKKAIELKQ